MSATNSWIPIAHCQDIPLREGRAVNVGNREIAIFNLGDRFLAVENRCPHKGGPLADGIVSGTAVVCPLHAWKMSLETGKGVNGPSASSCIKTYHTCVKDGIVLLQLLDEPTQPEEIQKEDLPVLCVEPHGSNALSEYPSSAEA